MKTATWTLTADAVNADDVQRASREVDGFENMLHSVRTINALIEMLYHVTENADSADASINWCAINDALAEARVLMGPIYAATSRLSEMARTAGLAQARRDALGGQ